MEQEDLHSLLTMIEAGMMVSITIFDQFSTAEIARLVLVTACGNPGARQSYETISHEIDELR